MSADPQAQAITEMLTWLEQQARESSEASARSLAQVDQVRRQVHDVAEEMSKLERAVREIDPKFLPFKGVPEKLDALSESTERLGQQALASQAAMESSMRQLSAEAQYDREERAEAFRRVDAIASQIGLVMADVAQVQNQGSALSQTVQALIERQRQVEARVDQLTLRLDRSIEVNRDIEQRIRESLATDQDDRFDVVFERLQIVGEIVKRNDEVIREVAAERSLRQEVLDEISVWRQEHGRLDGRINGLEETTDRLLSQVDKVHGEVVLLEGRHSGLGERVAVIRRDISEVVDQVRAEFAKFNQMTEKQRRKQIEVLEQELREMKFHGLKPPEEP